MRRIAAIYDIHGNEPALEAVLRDIQEVQPDLILVGGDIVFKRTDYDLSRAAERIQASCYPGAQEFVEENVLTVPTAAEAISVFEKLATRDS